MFNATEWRVITFSWIGKFNAKISVRGSPAGSVVKNLPANAGDTGSIPDPGRFHMPWSNQACASQLLSLCSGAWELQLRNPCAAATEAHSP